MLIERSLWYLALGLPTPNFPGKVAFFSLMLWCMSLVLSLTNYLLKFLSELTRSLKNLGKGHVFIVRTVQVTL